MGRCVYLMGKPACPSPAEPHPTDRLLLGWSVSLHVWHTQRDRKSQHQWAIDWFNGLLSPIIAKISKTWRLIWWFKAKQCAWCGSTWLHPFVCFVWWARWTPGFSDWIQDNSAKETNILFCTTAGFQYDVNQLDIETNISYHCGWRSFKKYNLQWRVTCR